MERRKFLHRGLLGSAAALTGTLPVIAGTKNIEASGNKAGKTFNADYAPHFGMFENHAGKDLIDQLKYMADQGFRSLEDNGLLGRPVDVQEKIGKELDRLGMRMGVFVIDGGDNWKVSLTSGKKEFADKFVDTCRRSVETAKRVNAKWATGVPGYFERKLPMDMQTAHVIDALRKGCEILQPAGLTMVLEPLSDNPDLFLRHSNQTFMICKAVNSPSCKILFDIYHMQRNEGDLIKNIDLCWDEIAYIQIGDNPGRKEPGTGEVNYKNVIKHLYKKGYRGVYGMEHGKSKDGKEGELALIQAYREADSFQV
ncbi:MAG: xylose isomerase [Segetibacter sp.]|jgi:hydroxypyruvate isomerase|nr:xylose isomerase [Segetibacter sp.]